ncbi:MAG: FHA domain-containing protein [Phycisphaerales bacterium]|nr:FHA domain-containing protein [Phycisphaerales bacterium]
MEVALVMFKADGTRKDFAVRKPRFVIGRKDTCSLRVPLPAVSREHCEVIVEEDGLLLRDLGSSNGTFHNGSRIQETPLEPGDQIVIGPVTFTVVIDGIPSDVEPTISPPARRADQAQPTAIPTATSSGPDGTADGLNLDDSDDLSALLADFDEDDSFVGLELDDDED